MYFLMTLVKGMKGIILIAAMILRRVAYSTSGQVGSSLMMEREGQRKRPLLACNERVCTAFRYSIE